MDEIDGWEVVQPLHVDPFSCGFMADNDSNCATYGHLVEDLLKGSKMYQRVHRRFRSKKGCFSDIEALEIFEHIVDYMANDLFPGWNEEDNPSVNHVWALGVILYFMLCGCPTAKESTDGQNDWYENLRLAKRSKEYSGRKRRWCDLSLKARSYLKKLLHYYPGGRPHLGWMITSEWAEEVNDLNSAPYRRWMGLLPPSSDDESEGAVETKKAGKENCRTLAQEQEMKRLKEATAHQRNDQLNDTKRKWSNFFEEATKLSKQKKRKINSAKRREKKEKKDVEKRILQYWEQLYWDRHNSHEDFRRYLNTPVPEWLESHNFLVDPSHDMLRRTDMKYDGNDFHRYKLIASTHKN